MTLLSQDRWEMKVAEFENRIRRLEEGLRFCQTNLVGRSDLQLKRIQDLENNNETELLWPE